MRAVLLLAALLLSSLVTTMAEEKEIERKKIGPLNPKGVPGDWKRGERGTKDLNKKIPGEWARGPIVGGPIAGGEKNVTGSNDKHLADVSEFVAAHLAEDNSGLHYVQVDAKVQVVAGLLYTLHYKGNDDDGVCQEEHVLVVFDKPWENERYLKSDVKTDCT